MSENQGFITVCLRWLAVLPGSLLAMLFSQLLLHLVLYQSLTGSGFASPYPETPERLLGPLAATFACVWGGSKIAPMHKVETAIALLGGTMLLIGGSGVLALLGAHLGNVTYYVRLSGLPVAGGIVGAFLGVYVAYREKLDDVKSKDDKIA